MFYKRVVIIDKILFLRPEATVNDGEKITTLSYTGRCMSHYYEVLREVLIMRDCKDQNIITFACQLSDHYL